MRTISLRTAILLTFVLLTTHGNAATVSASTFNQAPGVWNAHKGATRYRSTRSAAFGNSIGIPAQHRTRSAPKNWTLMVYVAADNDLFYFAWNNIRQLAHNANPNVNIIVLLNEPGAHKKTQVYLIEKNKAILLNGNNQEKLDSGNPQTLIDFCLWTIEHFPAENYMLDLWNHGIGILDGRYKTVNPTSFFVFNPDTMMLELDRNLRYLDMLTPTHKDDGQRGICFDDTYKTYLNNQDLTFALSTICDEGLNGGKLQIIALDACLMAMVEVASLFAPYAKIMVASQEVELGQGWSYDKILHPLLSGPLEQKAFAQNIVQSYFETYQSITSDFTLSAVDLDKIKQLEENIDRVSRLLLECLQNQRGQSVKYILRQCRRNIAFEEPSYVDLVSFYQRVLRNTDKFALRAREELKEQLKQAVTQGIEVVKKIVFANTRGSNITHANGLSIYFPEQNMVSSYQKTEFAQTNQWNNFITYYTMV